MLSEVDKRTERCMRYLSYAVVTSDRLEGRE